MNIKDQWDLYGDYLQLDKLLHSQQPWSAEAGVPAHDEMLFIIFHQVSELWFRQILFELDDIQKRMQGSYVDEHEMDMVQAHLDRIVQILRVLVRQIDVLETMPSQSFVDFREHLRTASGFQSLQFRLIETRLGLRREDRLLFRHKPYDDQYSEENRKRIQQAENRPSIHDQLDEWLARTPFIDFKDYHFWDEYKAAVNAMFDEKIQHAEESHDGETLATEIEAIERSRKKFAAIFSEQQVAEYGWRMSWRSLQSALFITIYRKEPILQMPARVLSLFMDVDELLSLWRYRHALMVQRMVGLSVGTGGSSGYGYLMQTLEKHRIFRDLFALSTYLIPSQALPELPQKLIEQMSYRYMKRKSV